MLGLITKLGKALLMKASRARHSVKTELSSSFSGRKQCPLILHTVFTSAALGIKTDATVPRPPNFGVRNGSQAMARSSTSIHPTDETCPRTGGFLNPSFVGHACLAVTPLNAPIASARLLPRLIWLGSARLLGDLIDSANRWKKKKMNT